MACGCSKKQNIDSDKSFISEDCFAEVYFNDNGNKYWSKITIENYEFLMKKFPGKVLDVKLPDCYKKEVEEVKEEIIEDELEDDS